MKLTHKVWIILVGVAVSLLGATGSMAQNGYDPWGYDEPDYDQPRYGLYEQPGDFYDELSPYGQWVQTPEYGNVWIPNAGSDFQPYASNGRWVVTEFGNTWVSDYAWGWAPFHYGRWYRDRYRGWAWIPGTEWGPAWVSWRSGGGYYGWAPMGPGGNINVNSHIPPNYWVFVPQTYITSPRLYNYCVPRPRVVNIYQNTTIINNVYRVNNRAYAYGPRREEIENVTRRSVPVYRVENVGRPGRTIVRNNSVGIYRPDLNRGWRGNGAGYSGNRPDYSRRNAEPRYAEPRSNRSGEARPRSDRFNEAGPRGNEPAPGNYDPDSRDTRERDNGRSPQRGPQSFPWGQRNNPRFEQPRPSQPVPQQPQTYPQPERQPSYSQGRWGSGRRQESYPQPNGGNQQPVQQPERYEPRGQAQPQVQPTPNYPGRAGSRGPR